MSTLYQKSVELLAELRDICDKNGIKYVLAPMTAARALTCGGFGYEFNVPAVAMPFDDAMKFKSLIEGGAFAGRSIECMENNPHYPTFSLDYVNDDTTMIDIGRGSDFCKHGVKVKIELLRPLVKDKSLRRWETLWECGGYRRVLSVKHQELNKPAHIGIELFRKNGKTSNIYKKMCQVYSGVNSDKYYLKVYHSTGAIIPKILLEDTREIEFEGEKFKVPSDLEGYLQKATNGIWKALLEKPERTLQRFVYYEDIPYAEIISMMEKNGESLEKIFNTGKEWFANTDERVKYNSEKKRLWDLATRSGQRAILYNSLNEQIDTIRKLNSENNFKELEIIFSEYDKDLHRFLDEGLGLCPNKELMDIECRLMKARGEDDKVAHLVQLVPKQHYKSVMGD